MVSPARGLARWLCVAACFACSIIPSSAFAEASAADKAAAEELFDNALALMRAGRTAEACPKLEQSQRIDPGIGTLLYLAECYEKLGRTASAWATFREAQSAAQASKQIERARMAEERSARLQPQLSKLTIEVADENKALPEFAVRRAGQPIASTLWGLAIPVDPGQIQVEASARGYATWTTSIKIERANVGQVVKIPALVALPAAAQTEPAGDGVQIQTARAVGVGNPPTSEPVRGGNTQRTIALVLGGVGVVGLGVGAFFGVRAIAKNSDAEEYCPNGKVCNDRRGVTLTDDAKDAAVVSNIAFGVGAAALISGAYLFLTGAPEKRARIDVSPVVSSRAGGVSVQGVFE